MTKLLIAYTTAAGSTAEVAEAIGQELAPENGTVDVRPAKEVTTLRRLAVSTTVQVDSYPSQLPIEPVAGRGSDRDRETAGNRWGYVLPGQSCQRQPTPAVDWPAALASDPSASERLAPSAHRSRRFAM